MLDWSLLVFGTYSPSQVKWAIEERRWQNTRSDMLREPLEQKYETLQRYLELQRYSERAKIQVTNYVNALKRGGLVKM